MTGSECKREVEMTGDSYARTVKGKTISRTMINVKLD